MGIQGSYNYTDQLLSQGESHHDKLTKDAFLGAAVISLAHWAGNRKRKKLGLPPEPMNQALGVGTAVAWGYVFWWVPFLIYMLLAIALGMHLLAFLLTAGIFIGAFILWKKHRNKRYAAYYTARAMRQTQQPANTHAAGSNEWVAQTAQRVRQNINGHQGS
jgi:Flp pilus assembly protein TadB